MTAEEAILKIDVRAAVEAAIEKEWWLIAGEDGCARFYDGRHTFFYERQHSFLKEIGEGIVALSREALAARLEESVRAEPERWLPPTSAEPLDYSGADADTLTQEIALLLDWSYFAFDKKKAK